MVTLVGSLSERSLSLSPKQGYKAAVQKCRLAETEKQRLKERIAWLPLVSQKDWEGERPHQRKEKRERRESEAKKVGDMEIGKVAAKNCDSGGNRFFHQCSLVAS
jgi:hypothetical protein